MQNRMTTRWLSGVAALVLVLSVRVVMAVPPASGPDNSFHAILDKLDQVLAAIANLSAGGPPPCGAGTVWQRFVVSQDGTEVCDNTTGLNWQKNLDSTQRTHADALAYCPTLGPASRLPEVKELISLVDYSRVNPPLPAGHPFTNVRTSTYWSATIYALGSSNAWGVDFGGGHVQTPGLTDAVFVWCLRAA